MNYSRKIRANSEETLGVFADGVNTSSPVFTVCTITIAGNRGAILHQCGGKHGKENAMKRFRWLANAKPYRSWQNPDRADASLIRFANAINQS